MSEEKYFQKALSNFTYEAASGGAIRHLADLGYSVKQIGEQLTFPTPYEKIQQTVWEHLIETGVILLEEPGRERHYEKVDFVKEYGKYGRTDFRRVTRNVADTVQIRWKERQFSEEKDGRLADYLTKKCRENGDDSSYVLCNFGALLKNEPEQFEKRIQILNQKQRDYVTGLFAEAKIIYHRLDFNMREIVARLYEENGYHGNCYFIKTEEKIIL